MIGQPGQWESELEDREVTSKASLRLLRDLVSVRPLFLALAYGMNDKPTTIP